MARPGDDWIIAVESYCGARVAPAGDHEQQRAAHQLFPFLVN